MIVFEFDTDLVNGIFTWFLGCTDCIGNDKQHSNEIYQQLDAQTSGLTENV